ncbi:HDOD domain-containing protein [Planctomicrobium sp. SH527]|uniref:HDOD domain-containing protein n=1 Tax=Planctomicrobium sp. SH527 TaxID=3448123 RepID=UPI003F5C109D
MDFRNHHQPHEISQPHFLSNVPREELEYVLELLSDEGVNLKDVVSRLQVHPALAVLIIKSVNAVKLGNQQNIRSLQHAIGLLGLDRTKQLLIDSIAEANERQFST